MTSIIVPALET